MPKTQPYRGQDRTLELIREKTQKTFETIDTINVDWYECWNYTCKELYCEMIAEGLRTTASEILKYVELEPSQTIVETSDSFRIVSETPKEFLDAVSNPEIGYPGELPDSNPIHTERCGVCGMNKIIGKLCVSGCITH